MSGKRVSHVLWREYVAGASCSRAGWSGAAAMMDSRVLSAQVRGFSAGEVYLWMNLQVEIVALGSKLLWELCWALHATRRN